MRIWDTDNSTVHTTINMNQVDAVNAGIDQHKTKIIATNTKNTTETNNQQSTGWTRKVRELKNVSCLASLTNQFIHQINH